MKKILLFLVLATSVAMLQAQAPQKIKDTKNTTSANTAKEIVAPGSSLLYGMFSAPTGTSIVLQNNGKNDFVLAARKESGKTFSTNTFNFTNRFLDGTKYKVTLKKAPIGTNLCHLCRR